MSGTTPVYTFIQVWMPETGYKNINSSSIHTTQSGSLPAALQLGLWCVLCADAVATRSARQDT